MPITHKMLSMQLKELERDGIINRVEYAQVPPKVEYSLTLKGENLFPILIYYSLVESAKMNNLDIHNYLEYILTQIQDEGKSVNYNKLLPYAPELPDGLRIR